MIDIRQRLTILSGASTMTTPSADQSTSIFANPHIAVRCGERVRNCIARQAATAVERARYAPILKESQGSACCFGPDPRSQGKTDQSHAGSRVAMRNRVAPAPTQQKDLAHVLGCW